MHPRLSKIDTSNFFCIWVSVCLLRKPVAVIETCDQDELLSTGLGANFRMFRTSEPVRSGRPSSPSRHRGQIGKNLLHSFPRSRRLSSVRTPGGRHFPSPPCPRSPRPLRCRSRMARRENAAHRDCALARPLVCRPHPLSLPPSFRPPTSSPLALPTTAEWRRPSGRRHRRKR